MIALKEIKAERDGASERGKKLQSFLGQKSIIVLSKLGG